MADPVTSMAIRDVIVAALGLCVGSFLNVLALRTVKEESLISPPSTCPNCQHRIAAYDLIPVVSYMVLNGRCRYCQKPIHWMYPLVEVLTACTFVILLHMFVPGLDAQGDFHTWGQFVGMAIFFSTLIAICITDFREMLIPHEITYPSMVLGIIYSGLIRNDWTGSFIGIGICYILMDFLAFYGLKVYIAIHGDPNEKEDDEEVDPQIDSTFDLIEDKDDEEEFAVMGGADTIVAAVIAAWLGLAGLGIALMAGFLIGAVLGAFYLVVELVRQNKLKQVMKPALIGTAIMVAIAEGMLVFVKTISVGVELTLPYLPIGLMAGLSGALIGVLRSGLAVSKAFPFGPALALGAVVAVALKRTLFPDAP